MKGAMHIISPDTTGLTSFELDAPPTLETLRKILDNGYIELVPGFTVFNGERCIAYSDEEGKRKQLPLNRAATIAWVVALNAFPSRVDMLRGKIIVITGDNEFLASQ